MGNEHHLFLVNTRLELWGYTGTRKKTHGLPKRKKNVSEIETAVFIQT